VDAKTAENAESAATNAKNAEPTYPTQNTATHKNPTRHFFFFEISVCKHRFDAKLYINKLHTTIAVDTKRTKQKP
jgi:hypothetical protein